MASLLLISILKIFTYYVSLYKIINIVEDCPKQGPNFRGGSKPKKNYEAIWGNARLKRNNAKF